MKTLGSFPDSGKCRVHLEINGEKMTPQHFVKEDAMGKFLWFLGGCATGLLAAAAIESLCEEETAYVAKAGDESESEETMSDWVDEAVYPEAAAGNAESESKIIIPAT